MKRYTAYQNPLTFTEDDDGEWVRHEDVAAEVERLQAEVDKLRNRHVPDSSCLSCGGPLQVCATFGLCCPCMPHEGHTTP